MRGKNPVAGVEEFITNSKISKSTKMTLDIKTCKNLGNRN